MQSDSCNFLYRYLTVVSSAPRRAAIPLSDNLTLAFEGETALSEIRERKIFMSSSSMLWFMLLKRIK
ncbi:MAG TPA: hypothetical protein VFF30_15495 [Nitrososphaerales archaeon]|nr:hypothetical protein [Nitrososphaerales archaeon]